MSLAWIPEPSDADLWSATARVLEAVRDAADPREHLDAGLDAVVRELGADRGFLVLGDGTVRSARGPMGALDASEREELGRRLVREACASQRRVFWDGADDDAPGSLGELGILAAIAAPVRVGPGTGALYVDVREIGKSFGEPHERFVDLAAALLEPLVRDVVWVEARERELEHAREVPPVGELLASPALEPLAAQVRLTLRSDLNVLILGESGSGKTLLAQAIARARSGPVVRATLGSSDDLNTITSELFGHVRGAFSGAVRRRTGLVEHANGGTLILDEVLDLPLHAQQLLLDLTQFGTYRPLGDDAREPRHATLRILAATNGDLEAAMESGRFRRDLYFRLAGHVLKVPPLRERRGDLPVLAEAILRRFDPARAWHLSLGARRALTWGDHAWVGNVRELEAVVMRARARALEHAPKEAEHVLELVHFGEDLGPLPERPESSVGPGRPEPQLVREETRDVVERWAALERAREALADEERAILHAALAEEDGVVSRVARRLGVPRTSLLHRIQLHDVGARTRREPE
jgi:DNA-binding NtrC family response regulator